MTVAAGVMCFVLVILCGAILYPGTAEGQYCLDQGIDVAGSGAVIDDRRADRQAAVDRRRRWRSDPGFVEIAANPPVHPLRLPPPQPEAGPRQPHTPPHSK